MTKVSARSSEQFSIAILTHPEHFDNGTGRQGGMEVCLDACMDVGMYGCRDVWIHMGLCVDASLDVRMYGCTDLGMYGCRDIWMYGCRDIDLCMWMGKSACSIDHC